MSAVADMRIKRGEGQGEGQTPRQSQSLAPPLIRPSATFSPHAGRRALAISVRALLDAERIYIAILGVRRLFLGDYRGYI